MSPLTNAYWCQPLLGLDDIQKKKNMLNILSDVGSAVENQKKGKGK
eukprot:SAG31_NODE_443_length_15645_cov_51.693169_12_plen_45_part_01